MLRNWKCFLLSVLLLLLLVVVVVDCVFIYMNCSLIFIWKSVYALFVVCFLQGTK